MNHRHRFPHLYAIVPALCLFMLLAVVGAESGLLSTERALAAQVSPPISPLPHADQPAQAATARNPLLDGAGSSAELWYAFGTLAAVIGVAALAIWREP